VRPDDLAGLVIREVVARSGVPEEQIEDVWFGCANQAGEDNRNVARMGALLAGLPQSVAGVTVNRLCASGLTAVVGACHAVLAGDGDLFVAGGVESMSRAPFAVAKPDKAFPRGNQTMYDTHHRLALPEPEDGGDVPATSRWARRARTSRSGYGVSRADQDAFALGLLRLLSHAVGGGRGGRTLRRRAGAGRRCHARRASAARHLAREARRAEAGVPRRPGTVTAGNAAGINDGAAALVIASEEKARELGIEAARRVRGQRRRGVDPRVMGIGPVPAVQKLLARAGVGVSAIDLVELTRAFAAAEHPR